MILSKSLGRIPSYLPEVAIYLNNIQAAGGSIKMESLMSIDRFVRACKDGGFWDKLQEVIPIAGADLTTALVKLKFVTTATMTGTNMVAGDYSEATGIAGNGTTKHIDTNFSASNLGATGHISAYLREQETVNPADWIGAGNGSHVFNLGTAAGALQPITFWGGVANSAGPAAAPLTGFYLGNRISNSDLQLHRNGGSVATQGTATTPAGIALNVYLLARNTGAVANRSAKKLSFFSIGQALSAAEIAAFYTAVQNLQTALGRNV